MGWDKAVQSIIVGCGFVGTELAHQLHAEHHAVACIVQSKRSCDQLSKQGLDAMHIDLDKPDWRAIDFNPARCEVYYFVPPGKTGNSDTRIDSFLARCQDEPPRRIVYISTSGVYGNCNGDWVDETRPVAPITARARRRLYAEHSIIRMCQQSGCEYQILRVGGIYGAERLPIHRLHEVTVICPAEAPYSNRIHVVDLAQACRAAMRCSAPNQIINVADVNPTTMTDYFYQIADLAGLPRPACIPMSQAQEKLSAGMLSFVSESRRLSTEKMNSLLNIELKFPTLASGLRDCFEKLRAKEL